MANIWEKPISTLAGNLNSSLSYLITTVCVGQTWFIYWPYTTWLFGNWLVMKKKKKMRWDMKTKLWLIQIRSCLTACRSGGQSGSRNCLNGSPAALDCTLAIQPASHCQPLLGGASEPRLCVETISCYVIRSVGAVCVIWTFLSRNSSYLCRAFAL